MTVPRHLQRKASYQLLLASLNVFDLYRWAIHLQFLLSQRMQPVFQQTPRLSFLLHHCVPSLPFLGPGPRSCFKEVCVLPFALSIPLFLFLFARQSPITIRFLLPFIIRCVVMLCCKELFELVFHTANMYTRIYLLCHVYLCLVLLPTASISFSWDSASPTTYNSRLSRWMEKWPTLERLSTFRFCRAHPHVSY